MKEAQLMDAVASDVVKCGVVVKCNVVAGCTHSASIASPVSATINGTKSFPHTEHP